MKLIYKAFATIIPLLCTSCLLCQNGTTTFMDLLPRDTDVPGWVEKSRKHYDMPEKIAKLDGNYEVYNTQEIAGALYWRVSSEDTAIEVSVLKCDTSLNAFGFFSIERGFSEVRFLKDDSYFSDQGLFFRKGEYYIKLTTENSDDKRKSDLNQFRDVIEGQIAPIVAKDELPEWIGAFSQTKSLSDLVYYRRESPFIPGLRRFFVRKRIVEGKDTLVYFSKRDSNYDARTLFQSILKDSGSKFTLAKAGGIQFALRENDSGDYLLLANRKSWIFGVINAPSIAVGNKIIITLHNELGGL